MPSKYKISFIIFIVVIINNLCMSLLIKKFYLDTKIEVMFFLVEENKIDLNWIHDNLKQEVCKLDKISNIPIKKLTEDGNLLCSEKIPYFDITLLNLDSYGFYYFIEGELYNYKIYDKKCYIFYLFFIVSIIISFFIIATFRYMLKHISQDDLQDIIIMVSNKKSLLANTTLISFIENIHHELGNTLRAYRTIYEELLYFNQDLISTVEYKDQKKIKKLFNMFDNTSQSLESFINKFRMLKAVKHMGKTNTSLYDLVIYSIDSVGILKDSSVKFYVDSNLKKLCLDKTYSLENGDFNHIVINHVKNSIEASALSIDITLNKVRKGVAYITIRDDGQGVPKELWKKLFNHDTSSKQDSWTNVRGNGLAFNKEVLKSAKGDVNLSWTEEGRGTIFLIEVKIKECNNYEESD